MMYQYLEREFSLIHVFDENGVFKCFNVNVAKPHTLWTWETTIQECGSLCCNVFITPRYAVYQQFHIPVKGANKWIAHNAYHKAFVQFPLCTLVSLWMPGPK